jgi:carbon monoxide dehydrogenase subunit G
MDLSHQFSVPTSVEETWAHFQDIASVAECFPGAQVTSADGDSFSGTVKVKLGPIALVYAGSGTFVEKDEAAHRFVVDAKGKDKRGNGTAGAKVTLAMSPGASSGTDVSVVTDLAVTGKPAQFGRGVMQDVSDKLLGQFVACLEQRLGSSADPDPAPSVTAGPQSVAAPTDEAAEPAPSDPAPASVPETGAGAATPPSAADVPPAPAPPTAAATRATAPPGKGDDAINLGSTVLPILFKNYWKQGLGLLVIIVLIVVLVVAL